MAVTNPTQLPAIAFSKNPLWLILASDAYVATAGVAAVNYLEFRGAVNANDQVTLKWGSVSQTMTAVAVPDDSGFQFPSGAGDQAYVTSLIPYFQGSYLIDRDFTVSTDFAGTYPRLVFTALNTSSAYTFTGQASGNITQGASTAGATLAYQSNFAIHQELWIKRYADAAYRQAWSYNVELDVPVTGKTTVDISNLLHNFLADDKPALGVAAISACLNSVALYYCKYAEYYGQTPMVLSIKKTDPAVIVLGGLSKYAATQRNIISELCPAAQDTTQNRFMRQGSKNKLITAEQPEWLFFLNPDATIRDIDVEVTLNFSDGTNQVYNPFATYQLQAYSKIQFPVGFDQLNLANVQPAKTVTWYTIRLKWGNVYFTDSYAYVLDNNYREWPRYFVYRNAYGAYQTIGTIGKGQTEFDRLKADGHLSKDPNLVPFDGDFLEYNILIQEKGTANTGYQRSNKRNMRLIRDFMASQSKFIYENGRLIPIGVTATNQKDPQDGATVYATAFQYFYLYQEELFTEDPGQADDLVNELLGISGLPPVSVPINNNTDMANVIKIKNTSAGYSAANGQIIVSDARLATATDVTVESTQLNAILPDTAFTLNNQVSGKLTITHEPLNDGEYLSITLIF